METAFSNEAPTEQTLAFDLAGRPERARARRAVLTFAPGEIAAGRFEIRRFLGQGGMGQVFEARDLTDRPQGSPSRVALKVIRPDIAGQPGMVERFKSEVRLARQVTHPNVYRVFDLFHHTPPSASCWGRHHRGDGRRPQGVLILVMEMLRGETLDQRLKRGPLVLAEALPLLRQMTAALEAAHDAGIVHRDFKSGNVMLTPARSGTRAILTDFGLALSFPPLNPPRGTQRRGSAGVQPIPPPPAARRESPMSGTPGYIAPEILAGRCVTPAADIFSLGVVIYEMLTGTRPRHHGTAPRADELRPCRELDPVRHGVVRRCLAPEPSARYCRASEVFEALAGARRMAHPRRS